MNVSQEIMLVFKEDNEIVAVAAQNGSTTFYNTTKMIKDNVATLLMENNTETVKSDKSK